jgi:thiol-disulfide isomerase/thioredoxin
VLCIAENWCIDCANGVPIISFLSGKFPNWQFRIVSRDENKDEFETFYTTIGRKKIPLIIFADEDGDEIMRWVERPLRSYQLLAELKDQNLSKEDFYNKYNGTLEFQPPFVSDEILTELIFIADKSASIVHMNPPSKKA